MTARVAVFFAFALSLLMLITGAQAQTENLNTKPVGGAPGGIAGRVGTELTHALALHRDRVQCFRAELSEGGKTFRFTGLPTGKYDLVLITKSGLVYEGLALGDAADKLAVTSRKNLDERVAKADTFFNKARIHRLGLSEDGETLLAFIERLRDKEILRQSGEVLNSNLRRFEVAQYTAAKDNWQQMETRHIYREEAPVGAGMGFFTSRELPQLGNIRIIDSVKDLGIIVLPPAK